jgi:hypothetical protein
MSLTDTELLNDYPCAVLHPTLKGCYFLLTWYSEDKQNSIILAKTQKGIINTFSSVLASTSEADPKEFFHVEVVSPPLDLKLAYAKQAYSHEINIFKDWVVRVLMMINKRPDYIKNCTRFKGNPQYYEGLTPHKWCVKEHLECLNCYRGFSFDAEALFELKKTKYREMTKTSFLKQSMGLSLAPEADPTQKLFAVVGDFGHHRPGMKLIEVTKEGVPSGCLFFCHAEELSIPRQITQKVKEAEKARKEKEAIRLKIIRAEQDKKQLAEIQQYEEFFF